MTSDQIGLPHVLDGQRQEVNDARAGLLSYYVDGPTATDAPSTSAPLLLIHSINATASAHEVKPLFDAYKASRPCYALDLPGYGHSERSQRHYCQALMVAAILAMLERIGKDHPDQPVDALAVSLSCEFLGKAALEARDRIRSLALVNPTGFAKITRTHGPPEADLGKPGVYRFLSRPRIGKNLYRLLTSRPSVRFFLKKTFGSTQINEEMLEQSCRLGRTRHAERAPLYFISGFMFSADIRTVFRALPHSVWLAHGLRGDFKDFSRLAGVADQANWQVTAFETGAMPYFEAPESFIRAYDLFLGGVNAKT